MSQNSPHFQVKDENSWYLQIGRLFFIFCECGQRYSQSSVTRETPDLPCPRCGNDRFMESHSFLYDENIRFWRPFYLEYRVTETSERLAVDAVVRLPEIPPIGEEPALVDRTLYTLNLDLNFYEIEERIHYPAPWKREMLNDGKIGPPFASKIRRKARRILLEEILKHPPTQILWLTPEKLPEKDSDEHKLDTLLFFLRHPECRDLEYLSWQRIDEMPKEFCIEATPLMTLEMILGNRQEKSVRRALFDSYRDSIAHGAYDPLSDYILCRNITDPNHLSRTLAIAPAVKANLFLEMEPEEARDLILLLRRLYTEKGLTDFLCSIDSFQLGAAYLTDIRWMLQELGTLPDLHQILRPLPRNPQALHDRLHALFNKLPTDCEALQPFSYTPRALKAQRRVESLDFRLPTDARELFCWGETLRNCLNLYPGRIRQSRSLIYGVFCENRLLYALEISDSRLVQCSGMANTPAEEEDLQTIRFWHAYYFSSPFKESV